MSSDDDLINFEVGSPDFPQNPLTTLLHDETSPATLLDSELFHLEETLQTASSTPVTSRSRSDSVELEQILITIDDDNARNKDNLVVENALEKLDRIINESTNTTNSVDENISVEECLKDLDNYLQEFDTSGSDLDPEDSSLARRIARSNSLRAGQQNFGYESDTSKELCRKQPCRNTIEARHYKRPFDENVGKRLDRFYSIPNTEKRPLSANLDDYKTAEMVGAKNNCYSQVNQSKKRSLSVDLDSCSGPTNLDQFSSNSSRTNKRPLPTNLDDHVVPECDKRVIPPDLEQINDPFFASTITPNKASFESLDNFVVSPKQIKLYIPSECDSVIRDEMLVPENSLFDFKNKLVSQFSDDFLVGKASSSTIGSNSDLNTKRPKSYTENDNLEENINPNFDNFVSNFDKSSDKNRILPTKLRKSLEIRPKSADNYSINRNHKSRNTIGRIPLSKHEENRRKVTTDDVSGPEQINDDNLKTGDRKTLEIRPNSAENYLHRHHKLRNTIGRISLLKNRENTGTMDVSGPQLISNDNFEVSSGKSLENSADSAEKLRLNRNNKLRNTIGRIPFSNEENKRKLGTGDVLANDNVEMDCEEEIDWSWIESLTQNESTEDTTGSISDVTETETEESFQSASEEIQPHILQATLTNIEEFPSSSDTINATNLTSETPEAFKDDVPQTWLRSSMRRLRHFNLPSSLPPPLSTPALITSTPVSQPVTLNRETVRPVSAPVAISRTRSESESSRSRNESRARSLSSSESSLDSVESREETGEAGERERGAEENIPRRPCDSTSPPPTMPDSRSPLGQWPHGLSSMLACLGCTLGLFNLSRFATLTVRFGANFIIQFLILSLIFGIPLFTLQLCLGQQLGAGVVDMWRISPLFQGVGIAILAAQALIGLYSIVGVSWMFIYFRDSFITKQDQYKWAEPYEAYREDSRSGLNGTYKISETVPDYFNGIVLQRHGLVTGNSFGAIKFQVAFNLAVVWMIVFVSLSKGLRSYAKVVYVFSLLPIFGTFVLCAKLLGMSPSDSLHEIFPATAWGEFFVNTKSWIAASQEAFLTWGLLGAAVMQISSHNKHKHLLQRDSSLVIILTIMILMLTAFLANTCIEILHANGYSYVPNSFEKMSTYVFLRSNKDPLPPSLSSTPVRYMTHSSFIIGERVVRPGMDKTMESGYQVLRFATELVPATLALLGPTQISPFWAVLFYFVLILFGIAQQLAIWHCVITGIMAIRAKVLKSWETTITFFTCTFGFILGLPMTTEFGIFVVYFLDYCVGGVWWLIFVYLLQIVAVFMIRGRPYSGDTVVTALFTPSSGSCFQAWMAPLLSFIWNVILPVALMVVCITQFKSGNFRELFIWHHAPSVEYWPTWARQIGSLLQLIPILCVPVVAIVQSYRYLNNGPPDILDRIQLLYRPPLDSEHLDDLTIQQTAAATANTTTTTNTNIPAEDPPPKYTPPPSYTTATGARIAKMLRQSIRRSVRRIANVLGEGSQTRTQERPQLQVPPPDYCTVLVEMNQSQATSPHVTIDVTDSQNSLPTTQSERISRELSTHVNTLQTQGSPLTAADVAFILRSSFRRSTVRTAQRARRSAPQEIPSGSLSAECLVDGIAPLGEDSLILETIRREGDSKTPDDNRSSVI